MPVPVLVGSWDTIRGLVREYPPMTESLVKAFWPGGLSIVVPQAPSLPWNLGDTRGTVMLRMPLHPIAIELLRRTGPMAVSSANISGQEPALTAVRAKQQLGAEAAVYLDGGRATIGKPSTIVDLSGHEARILREGAITAEQQLGNAVSVYLDGGETPIGKPSTIIDLSGPTPYLLREGALSAERIGEVIGVDPEVLRTRP